ncbi:MAG: glycosyltransferase family 4 protein [Deltaproteobacteria bacterium]|nr:glycosyltransferase family 4 protein [Deltaproteobacteria bacterium]
MRIGIIRKRWTPFGGAEVFLKRFISGLIKKGHLPIVFSSDWPEEKGIEVKHVRAPGPCFLKPLFFAINAKKAVEASDVDVVISLERTNSQDIYRAGDGCHKEWLIKRKRIAGPIKRLLISINPLHRVLLYLEKKCLSSQRLKAVAANSKMVKDEIQRHYGLPDDKFCVIYNGINQDELASLNQKEERQRQRKSLSIPDAALVLLFVGSGFERKGLIYLIRSLPLIKENSIRLVVIGKGNQKKYISEAERLGVGARVVFLGPVKDAYRYYPAGDIFVLPSIYEPFSNACLEAMASGLPVVTSRANGASEVITEALNGAIVQDPADPAEIAAKITLFLDVEKRKKAGKLARDAVGKLTIEKNVNEFLRLIEDEKIHKH